MTAKPKKSLGQHFLQDKQALERIVKAADLKVDDNVIEIGPGTGVLTNVLTSVLTSGKLIAIEKDSVLAHEIKNQKSNLKIIEGDILEINLPRLIEENDFFDYKVVANIPYYITGKIIRLLFETKYSPKLIVLLVQKEVAQRICAKPGDMSILAASVQFFGKPEIVAEVPKESFSPVPKVDSAILKIVPFENQIELKKEAKELFRLVKIGFASRRKTLANNLAAGLQISKKEIEKIIRKCSLNMRARAEDLSIEEWKLLQQEVEKQVNTY